MAIGIGQTPDAGFDQPLQLLSDCHRRIEKFLDILLRVVKENPGISLKSEYRDALTAALKYFRNAAPWHTRDEEDSLFPRMRKMDDQRVREALNRIDALENDHQRAQYFHDQVETLGKQWLDSDHLHIDQVKQLDDFLFLLREMYRKHISEEDNVIFPLASEVLSDEQLHDIGREMAIRRGIDPENPKPRCKYAKANRTRE